MQRGRETKHVRALAVFTRELAAKRRAFFRAHADAAARRAFVARQRARLGALKRAAGCRVGPERADVSVSMSASGVGELVFRVVVLNRGPGRAIAARVTDPLPRGVELVSATSTSGSCSRGPNVTCGLKTLAPGAKVTVTISTRRYLTGVIENAVSVEAATPDPSSANNAATARSTDVPLPAASSGPACAPELTFPGPRAYFHLGPTNYALYQQATGRLGALLLFVDFPDAPSTVPTAPIFTAAVPALSQWYAEASYGRLTLAFDQIPNWLRLPKSALAYDLHYRGDYPGIVARHRAFLADAVAAATRSWTSAGTRPC